MSTEKVRYFIKADNEERRDFVRRQDNCPLCNDLLLFSIFDIGLNLVGEKTYCKTCDIQTRSKEHVLQ